MNPTPITITLPLKDFLEILWHGRDIAYPDENIAKQIQELDSQEKYSKIDYYKGEKGNLIYRCWTITRWKESELKRLRDKEIAEKDRKEFTYWKECLERLTLNIMKESFLDKEVATVLARSILDKGNKNGAAFYGVEDIKWEDLNLNIKHTVL
jgi:hypothetical protein